MLLLIVFGVHLCDELIVETVAVRLIGRWSQMMSCHNFFKLLSLYITPFVMQLMAGISSAITMTCIVPLYVFHAILTWHHPEEAVPRGGNICTIVALNKNKKVTIEMSLRVGEGIPRRPGVIVVVMKRTSSGLFFTVLESRILRFYLGCDGGPRGTLISVPHLGLAFLSFLYFSFWTKSQRCGGFAFLVWEVKGISKVCKPFCLFLLLAAPGLGHWHNISKTASTTLETFNLKATNRSRLIRSLKWGKSFSNWQPFSRAAHLYNQSHEGGGGVIIFA